jgi:hypothetical protein
MAFGIIAALGQVNIATAITGPVLIAVLATIGGVIVVGFGGGLIKPAQDRWRGWMANMQQQLAETPQQRTGEMGRSEAPHAMVGADNTPTPPVGTPRPQL